MVATGLLTAHTFYVGDHALERVTKFSYLGRILSQDDHDLSASVRNIQRAKTKWAAVSRVPKEEMGPGIETPSTRRRNGENDGQDLPSDRTIGVAVWI
jgi:hypothetical protein